MSTTFEPRNYRVALLAGGASKEREISLASGKGAKKALEEAGFSVCMIDPAEKSDLRRLIDEEFDVAFISLHGKLGEDGTMQGFLEIVGIPYIGSGVWSSSLAMNKAKSKVFYENESIKTPRSMVVTSVDEISLDQIVEYVGEKSVVKPVSEGSAVGVSIVENKKQLQDAIAEVLKIDQEALIETYVSGTELTVAVLGNDDIRALPIIQIIPTNEFYDFESKYAPGGSQHLCPAPIDEEHARTVNAMALKAHRALECRALSRSDFILDEEGECWILETNTIPGMTETSLLPDAGRAAGISFSELCTSLIELALEDKQK